MEIRFWPPENSQDVSASVVAKVLQRIQSRDPELWDQARERLSEAERPEVDLATFERRGWVERMPHTNCALYEMKIPQQRKKGVLRIYFCCDPSIRNCIWMLEAEHKVGKGEKEHRSIVGRADERCCSIRSMKRGRQ